jgi:hypothetical protein
VSSLLEIRLERWLDDAEFVSLTTMTGTGEFRRQNRETLFPGIMDFSGDFP